MNQYLDINPEVAEALAQGKAVVALESTIISHGMPYPQNVETALAVEQIIREQGAVPATIAILNGRLKAGLTKEEIEYLGKQGQAVTKASRRDLAALVARGAETTMDISADLEELAQTGVMVVCAGAKAILDLELTLEYLETHGVPVLGYGTQELPAFYTRTSGLKVDYQMDSPEELASFWKVQRELGLKSGVLVANPIPEEYSMDAGAINAVIDLAVAEAAEKGIHGKETTPFLLAKVKEITGGQSLDANIQLVFNNAKVAAQTAVAYCKL